MANNQEIRKNLEASINMARANGEQFEMLQKEFSNFMFLRYKSLQEAGFTEEQAFKIVLERGLN